MGGKGLFFRRFDSKTLTLFQSTTRVVEEFSSSSSVTSRNHLPQIHATEEASVGRLGSRGRA
jgi:hypothetical protein